MKYICPVCYYPNLYEYPNNGLSYEICPCCFVEFGFDGFEHTFELRREEWIAGGKKFVSAGHRIVSANDIKIHKLLQSGLIEDFLNIETVKDINLKRLRAEESNLTMPASEEVLGREWLTEEENEAWKDL